MKPRLEIGADIEIDVRNPFDVLPAWPNPRPRRQKLSRSQPLGLLVFLMLIAYPVQATIVVGLRDFEEIDLGADGIAGQTRSGSTIPMCKIYRVDQRTVFGFAGNIRYNRSGFNVAETMRALLRQHGAEQAGQDAMVRRITELLTHELETAVVNDPLMLPGDQLATIVLAHVLSDGTPEITRHIFRVSPPIMGYVVDVFTQRCPGHCGDVGKMTWIVPAGIDKATKAVGVAFRNSRAYSAAMRREGLAGLVRELLKVGIDACPPTECGGRISIVRLTARDIEWVECGECTEDEQCRPTPTPRP